MRYAHQSEPLQDKLLNTDGRNSGKATFDFSQSIFLGSQMWRWNPLASFPSIVTNKPSQSIQSIRPSNLLL